MLFCNEVFWDLVEKNEKMNLMKECVSGDALYICYGTTRRTIKDGICSQIYVSIIII